MKQLFTKDLMRAGKWYLLSKAVDNFVHTLLTVFLTVAIVVLVLQVLAEFKTTFGM